MLNVKKIAKKHMLMFKLHDDENWIGLKNNAKAMLIELGFGKLESQRSSGYILKAYKAADRAVLCQERGDQEGEEKSYVEVLRNFSKGNEILGLETKSLRYKVGWYRCARHKRHLGVLYNLLIEHVLRYGISNIDVGLYTFYVSFTMGYKNHNNHNWGQMEKCLNLYWKKILTRFSNKPPIEI